VFPEQRDVLNEFGGAKACGKIVEHSSDLVKSAKTDRSVG
jgi:hypothetical protein